LYELADLRIWTSGAIYLLTYLLTYKSKTEPRTLRIYGATNQSIVISLRITISYGLADLYMDLRGCTYGLAGLSMTTELAYSLNGFVWLYIRSVWTEIQENNTQ